LGSEDLGSAFQFTTDIGLTWHITARFEVNYRFLHMSNAGISSHNPGLNLHLVGLSWRL